MFSKNTSKQCIFLLINLFIYVFILGLTSAIASKPLINRSSSQVSAGYNHSAVVTTDGEVWMWGSNYSGQLGIGSGESYSYTPFKVQIQDVTNISTSMSTVDNAHTVALKSDGTVWTWGYNYEGQLGTGECCSAGADHYTPVQVPGLTNIVAIDSGNAHNIALESNGTVWTWGKNDAGQLGNGSSGSNLSSPYHITNFDDVIAIAAGGNHSLALKSDGTVWAWGDNSRAQLGDNTISNQSTPVQVLNNSATGYIEDIIAIDAGSTSSIALKNDGSVWAWGENSHGQAGQGSTSPTYLYTPTKVKGIDGSGYLDNIEAIAAGETHNIALASDGSVVTWGSNSYGQLGDVTNFNHYHPFLLMSFTDVQSIATGASHNIVIKKDSSVWSWGKGTNGQLGENQNFNRDYPVQVFGPTNGFLILGKYLPQTINMTEDVIKDIYFSMTDAEGGSFTISVSSNGSPPVESFYLLSSQASGNTITVSLSANESIDITLRLTPALNQYGTDEVNIIVSGDPNGVLTEESSINVIQSSDSPVLEIKTQWNILYSGVEGDLKDLWVDNSTHAFAVGYSSVVIEYENNNWNSINQNYSGNFYSVCGYSGNAINVSFGSTIIWYNGITWSDTNNTGSQTVHAMWGDAPLYAVGESGEIVKNDPFWEVMTSNTSQDLYGIFGNSLNEIYAVGTSGTIMINTSGSWGSMASNTSDDLHGIWANDTYAFAVGLNGTIMKYYSNSWSSMTSGTSNDLYGIWGTSEENLYAVGQNGIILKYDGTEWTEMNSPVTDTLYAVDGASEDCVFAVGENGTILKYGPENHKIPMNATSDPIVLTINEIDPEYLSVTVAWSNTELLTDSCFQIDDTIGSQYYYLQSSEIQNLNLLITPLTGFSGQSVITITVTDSFGLTSVESFLFEAERGPVVFQNYQNISTGNEHSLAIRNDGQLLTWGRNERGELGLGTYGSGNEKEIPVQVDHTGRFIAVAGGLIDSGAHSIGLKSDGTVWTWGNNSYGQIGNATSGSNRYTPYEVENLSNIVQIAAGNEHCLALNASNQVFAWGRNSQGQLGTVDNTDRYTAVSISGSMSVLNNVQQIAAGKNFSMALKKNGTVWTWGENTSGQLGSGDTNPSNTPIQVKAHAGDGFLTQVVAIAAGSEHCLALKNDGTVWAWGSGMSGRLGNQMDTGNETRPHQVYDIDGVNMLSNVIKIAAASSHSLVLKSDSTVLSFGNYMDDRLGYGDVLFNNKTIPIPVTNPDNDGQLRNIIDIASSGSHSLALQTDGKLLGWGKNNYGQVGSNNSPISQSIPIAVNNMNQTQTRSHILTNQNTTSRPIQVHMTHTVVGEISLTVTSNNSVLIPVDQVTIQPSEVSVTEPGQILSFTLTVTPTNNKSGSSTISVIATDAYGYSGSCDITIGVIGQPSLSEFSDQTMNQNSSLDIDFIMSDANLPASSLDVSFESSNITVLNDTSFDYDGTNENQVLTITPEPHSSGFVMITITVANELTSTSQSFGVTVLEIDDPPEINRVPFQVAASYNHSMVIDTDYKVFVWGSNYSGQLGNNSGSNQLTPVYINDLDDIETIAGSMNSSDSNHSLAVTTSGIVWAWGYNNVGQLGIGESGASRYTPVEVSGIKDIIDVDAGTQHSLALQDDGTVWAWGYNMNGQLGNGSGGGGYDSNEPVEVGNLSEVSAIACGGNHSLALKNDGTVWAWGNNSDGQLGTGDTIENHYPIQVIGPDYIGYLEDIIAIAAGDKHSLALKSDGTVWAWGANSYGELGQNSNMTSYYMYPVQVKGVNGSGFLTGITEIAAGYQHSLALKSNGTIVGWGKNDNSQLGNYSSMDKHAPVLVSNITGVQTIEAGGSHSIAIKRDGTVWTWGHNSSGQLGDNTTFYKDYPVQAFRSVSEGYLQLGTYLPTTLTIPEDQLSYICFSISDPEGGRITLTTQANNSDMVGDHQFTFSADSGSADGNSLVLTLTAFQSVEVTLSFNANRDQTGSTEIYIYADDGNTINTEEIDLTIQDVPDTPSFVLQCQWQEIETNTTTDLYGIWALNSQLIYAAGDTGIILKYDGNSWNEENHGYTTNLKDIWGTSSWEIFAVGSAAFILKYNGSSWMTDGGSGSENINAMWSDDSYKYSVGEYGEVLRYDASWSTLTTNFTDNLYSISGNSTHLFVAAETGIIHQYADSTWSSISLNTVEDLKGIWTNENTGFVVGTGGVIYKKISSQWTELNSNTTTDLNAVWATSAFNAYAVGLSGEIYHFDGEGPWTSIESPTTKNLNDIFGLSANRIYACGNSGTIIQWTPVNHVTAVDTASNPIRITLVEPDAESLTITITYSDSNLLTSTSFNLNGDNGHIHLIESTASQNEILTLTITPVSSQSGSSVITLTALDSNGYSSSENFTFIVSKGPLVHQNMKTISAGYRHSLAIRSDGQLMSWGGNDSGELGIDTASASANELSPVEVHASGRFIAVRAGQNDMYNHSLALKKDGTVWAWGSNEYGQIGDGNSGAINDRHEPVQVENLSGIVEIDAGRAHNIALDSEGNIWLWGQNTNGQLGTSDNIDSYTPVMLTGLPKIQSIAAGKNHTLALAMDGYVWAWGYNSDGQLGVNDNTDKNYPVQVMAPSVSGYLSNVVAISAGTKHSMALKKDGSVWAWGSAEYGRLGNNITSGTYSLPEETYFTNGSSPLRNIIAISAGHEHSLALTNEGKILAWGRSQNGRMGNGETMDSSHSLPIYVNNSTGTAYLKDIIAIDAGGMHSMALGSNGSLHTWGYNDVGQLGDNTTVEIAYPQENIYIGETQKEPYLVMSQNETLNYHRLYITDNKTGTIYLSATSSNTSLLQNANIIFGNGATSYTLTASGKINNITLTLMPETGQAGSATITIIALDDNNISNTSLLTLMVMGQPTITAIQNITLTENTSSDAIPFTITDSSIDASDLELTQE